MLTLLTLAHLFNQFFLLFLDPLVEVAKYLALKKKWSNMFYRKNYFICGLNDIRQIFLDIFFLIVQILSMSNVHNSSAMKEKNLGCW